MLLQELEQRQKDKQKEKEKEKRRRAKQRKKEEKAKAEEQERQRKVSHQYNVHDTSEGRAGVEIAPTTWNFLSLHSNVFREWCRAPGGFVVNQIDPWECSLCRFCFVPQSDLVCRHAVSR